jgi:serine protease Do
VLRGNRTVNLTATLDELKDDVGTTRPKAPEEEEKVEPRTGGTALNELGVSVKNLTPALANQLKLKVTQGVVISEIKEDSPAANAGLSEGDVVLRVGITPVTTVAEMQNAVKALLAGQPAGDKKVSLYVNVASELEPGGSGRRNVFVTLTVTQ